MRTEFSDKLPPCSDRLCQAALTAVLTISVAAPWLWPFTAGPSANVWPLLFSWTVLVSWLVLACAWPAILPSMRDAIPRGLLVAALVSAGLGLAQWFGVAPASILVSPAGLAEAFGNLRQRNQFATLMGIGLLSLLQLAGPRPRPLAFGAVIVLSAANAASTSRIGLLQLAIVASTVCVIDRGRGRSGLALTAILSYVAATTLLPPALFAIRGVGPLNVFDRASLDLGCSSRQVLWSNVLELIGHRPWTGWGLGELDFAHYATLYRGERFCDILDNAHNLPLHLAVELGIPLAAVTCVAAAMLVWRAKPWTAREGTQCMAWGVLLVVGLHSLVEYPLWYGPFQLAVLQAVWLLRSGNRMTPVVRVTAAAGGVALLACFVLAAAEYERVSQAYKPVDQRRPDMRQNPVASAGGVLLFRDQVEFAELSVTPLSNASAPRLYALARRLIHYSPEPAVIEKLIESAMLLGRQDEALWHAARYRAAFPERYREWLIRRPALRLSPTAP